MLAPALIDAFNEEVGSFPPALLESFAPVLGCHEVAVLLPSAGKL